MPAKLSAVEQQTADEVDAYERLMGDAKTSRDASGPHTLSSQCASVENPSTRSRRRERSLDAKMDAGLERKCPFSRLLRARHPRWREASGTGSTNSVA